MASNGKFYQVRYIRVGVKGDIGVLEDAIAPAQARERCKELKSEQSSFIPENSQSRCITIYKQRNKLHGP
jgi:hypothetical protein